MKYRHELKHVISYEDMIVIRSRLRCIMKPDSHADGGGYSIRSLYFDNLSDKALKEKIDGVNKREKFRIRFYNGDTSFIVLEKKSKVNSYCLKESARITKEEAQKLVDGDSSWLHDPERPLCQELYSKMKAQGLRPKTIVDYWREPFIYKPGNVRVTIDRNIRTGDFRTDFLNPKTQTLPTQTSDIVLEVKWDEFLPDIIRDAVQLSRCRTSAFSKYAKCRIYG